MKIEKYMDILLAVLFTLMAIIMIILALSLICGIFYGNNRNPIPVDTEKPLFHHSL